MKKWLVLFAGLLMSASAIAWCWRWEHGPEVFRLHGTVEVQEVGLGSKVGGRVVALQVKEGQVVEPGQTVLQLDAREWIAKKQQAESRLAAAQASLEKVINGPRAEEITEANAAVTAAKARLNRASAGFRDEQVRQAQFELDVTKNDLWRAQQDHDRLIKLQTLAPAAVSSADLDSATALRNVARGKMNVALAISDMMHQGSRPEDIEEATADYDRWMARYQLLLQGTRTEDKSIAAAALREAEASLAEARTNADETTVTAPERCIVEVVAVRPGDFVTPGRPVVRVLRADDLWVKVFVPSADLGKLTLGQSVAVKIDTHAGHSFQGTITQIASVSEFTPRNVQSVDERRHQVFAVKVRVVDPRGVFKSGMAAQVSVTVEGEK